jgi:hypothetical protein
LRAWEGEGGEERRGRGSDGEEEERIGKREEGKG